MTSKEDKSPFPEPKPQYNTTPLYARELRDSTDNELIIRETKETPFVTVRAPSKHSYVIEIVTIRSARIRRWDTEELKQDILNNGQITIHGIRINSPLLRHALNSVVKYYPGYDRFPRTAACITKPYKVIAHHSRELQELKSVALETTDELLREEAQERNKHIDCLMEFMSNELGDNYTAEYARHQQKPPVATFEYFWIALKPGTMVYRKVNGIWSCWVVKSPEGGPVDGRSLP